MPTAIPGPPPYATSTLAGLVSTSSQEFGGVKTFNVGATDYDSTICTGSGNHTGLRISNTGAGGTQFDILLTRTGAGEGARKVLFAEAGTFAKLGIDLANGQTYIPASARVINAPSIVLPGGAGGFGYGGGLEIGGQFNAINHDGTNLYYQAYGSGVTAEVRSFNSTSMLTGFFGAAPGASDVVTKIGTRTADGSVNAGAKLLSLRTGIGGTEVEYVAFKKNEVLFPGAGTTILKWDAGGGNRWEFRGQPNANFTIGNNTVTYLGMRIGDGHVYSDFGFTNPLGNLRMGMVNSPTPSIYFYTGATGTGGGDANYNTFASRHTINAGTTQGLMLESSTGLIRIGGINGIAPTDSSLLFHQGKGVIRGSLGAGASDVVVGIGTDVADGSVNATAHILSVRTGYTGSESEKFWVTKTGPAMTSSQSFEINGDGGGVKLGYRTGDGMAGIHNGASAYLGLFPGTGAAGCSGGFSVGGILTMAGSTSYISRTSAILGLYATGTTGISETVRIAGARGDSGLKCVTLGTESASPNDNAILAQFAKGVSVTSNLDTGNGTAMARVMATGRIDQSGTDSSGSPGAATIDKPTGISAVANGATTCVITNSTCTTTSRVTITFHADPGGRYWVTRGAGSFTVNLSAAAGADLPFSWEVSSIL